MAKYDRLSELKAFDETKAGVKGLIDAGVSKIPRIFHAPNDNIPIFSGDANVIVPVIDLEGVLFSGDPTKRKEIAERVGEASEDRGLFQIVNHGVSERVLEEMTRGVRGFHEQEASAKRAYYGRERSRVAAFNSNFDLYSAPTVNWKDTLRCFMAPELPNPNDLPLVCRDIFLEYSKEVMKVGILLLELISESLGLDPNHLKDMDCANGLSLLGHYYPPCPELTLGVTRHSDNSFITVVLQDHIGGLQVLRDNKWIDISPLPGALVVNIGDLLQLMTNDRFKSVEHRVVANRGGPRISAASIFSTGAITNPRLYGPIKQLLSENKPPKYKEITVREFALYYASKGLDGTKALDHFKLL